MRSVVLPWTELFRCGHPCISIEPSPWVCPSKVRSSDRVPAQAHLDIRELKYDLHVLMIQHGRLCKGCKTTGSERACILKTYLKKEEVDTDSTNED